METPRGPDDLWVQSQTMGLSLVRHTRERSAGASLPLATGLSVSDEIGTVLVDGIISQVHAHVVLGTERRKSVGLRLPLPALPGPQGLKDGRDRGGLPLA